MAESRMAEVLGAGGWLARVSSGGWEAREAQLEMARAIEDLLRVGGVLAIEAPTGVGKTLGYLVPSLLSGRKVIVSTQSKALQDQIVEKDLPRLAAALAASGRRLERASVEAALHEGGSKPLRYTVMKGRANYLCWDRLERRHRQLRLAYSPEAATVGRIAEWARSTERGDRAELAELPEDDPTFREVDARAEICVGSRCAHWERCFVVKMRREAELADLIVVNHHLLAADLALRAESQASPEGRSFGAVIPAGDALVVDEAHGLEDSAAEHFGGELSTRKLSRLTADVVAWCREAGRDDVLEAMLEASGLATEALSFIPDGGVRWRIPVTRPPNTETRVVLDEDEGPRAGARQTGGSSGGPEAPELAGVELAQLREAGRDAERALQGVAALFGKGPADAGADALARRAGSLADALRFVLAAADPDFVYWAERRGREARVGASPVEIGEVLRDTLYGAYGATVLTSATLAVGAGSRGLGYFLERVGAPRAAQALVLETPFAFADQAALYVPRALPEPGGPGGAHTLALEAERLINLVGGGAFFLFTSYRTLREVELLLRPTLRFPLLVQGEAPRARLLETFVRRAPAVLLATASFWEGIDVPGSPLRLVIIDRLPFAVPTDPVVRARIERLEQQGRSPFAHYQLPHAILRLKQGFGRLIRTRDDIGIVALLDPRVERRAYGRRFLDALPPATRVHDMDTLETWWRARERRSAESLAGTRRVDQAG